MWAAAEVRLIVRCKACGHQVEPDPVEMATRYGAETSVLDWREKLVFFKCGSRGAPGRNTGGHAIRALTREAVASPADHIRRSTLRRAYRTSRNESAAQCGSSSDSPLEELDANFSSLSGSVPLRTGGGVPANHMARPRGVSPWRDSGESLANP